MSQYFYKYRARNYIVLLLALVLSFTWGCGPASWFGNNNPESGNNFQNENYNINNLAYGNYSPNDNPDFVKFTQELFADTLTDCTLTMHSYVEHPEKYGIKDYEVTLGRYDLDDLDPTKEITDYINRLKAFNRDSLSERQQITYDQLMLNLTNNLEYSDLYLYGSELSTTIGIQVQLPIAFAEYPFYEKKDVEEYIKLLEDTDGYFENLVEYEKLRSKNGLFMQKNLAEEIIEQCDTFLKNAKGGYLYTTFEQRLSNISGLTDAEKKSFIERNQQAVENHVMKGYEILRKGLDELKSTGKYSGGLCNYPQGKKYYECILKSSMGYSKTVAEYDALLDTYLKNNMLAMSLMISKNQSIANQADAFSFGIDKPADMLDNIKKYVDAEFPAGPDIRFSIKYIDESLKDYASPAMYFCPQIDNYEENNSIYINPKTTDKNELYTTMAHEGYPGHMYQMTYFVNTNPDPLRYLLEPGGFVEGWATYIEEMSYGYTDSSRLEVANLLKCNYATIMCIYGKIDIGVNYYGWNESKVLSFLETYGLGTPDVAKEIYNSMVSEPGNYCKYVLGSIAFKELKKAASEMTDSFDVKQFHKYILDLGPVPFDMLFDRLNYWYGKKS